MLKCKLLICRSRGFEWSFIRCRWWWWLIESILGGGVFTANRYVDDIAKLHGRWSQLCRCSDNRQATSSFNDDVRSANRWAHDRSKSGPGRRSVIRIITGTRAQRCTDPEHGTECPTTAWRRLRSRLRGSGSLSLSKIREWRTGAGCYES